MKQATAQTAVFDIKNVERDSGDTEYEIKLECLDTSKSLADFLNIVEAALAANPRYVVDRVHTVSEMTSHFLVDANNEYSVFRYNKEVMLKIKRHDIIKGYEFPIFKNSEQFEYDLNKITQRLNDEGIAYIGSMLKRRIKDFLIDSEDGRVYSLAVTICESGNKRQYQLEVEYYGHIRDYYVAYKNNESDLLTRLVSICGYIRQACQGQFAPSVERKYEFVVKNGAVDQAVAKDKKAHLLKNLEEI